MGIIEALFCSIISLFTVIASVFTLHKKKYFVCFLFSLFAIIFMGAFSYFWMLALADSGKSLTLLGYQRYPMVVFIVVGIQIVSVVNAVLAMLRIQAPKNG